MRAAAVALLILVRVAHADVGVVVSGEPVMQAPLMAQVQGWLQTHEYGLVAAPLGGATNTFIDCFVIEDMTCAKRTFDKESRATNIVYARADLDAGAGATARDFTLTTFWFVKGREPVTKKRACKQCDDAQLALAVDALMTELEKANGLGNGTLKVTAGPEGMTVKVDSVDVGAAPLERELTPGRHELSFVHRGRVVDSRPVRIEPGATIEVASPAVVDEVTSPKRGSRTLPVSLLIGGAALAIAGGVFLYYGSLGGPDEPYVYTNANKIGAPLTIGGGVAAIAGGVLMVRGTF